MLINGACALGIRQVHPEMEQGALPIWNNIYSNSHEVIIAFISSVPYFLQLTRRNSHQNIYSEA